MAIFYVIGTPIGNLDDITIRAIKALKESDFVLCEDTRVTQRLLSKHGILTRAMSYHIHSKLSRTDEIIAMLKHGKNLSLVSDAGTPGISDPGSELVAHIRDKCAAEIASDKIAIRAVPGPSALATALSVAGVVSKGFTFLGFLPHKKGRKTLFEEIARSRRTMIFYESPHRIMKTLESLAKCTENGKRVTVCRELTKIFEEVVSGTAAEIGEYFKSHKDKVRGEFVVIV